MQDRSSVSATINHPPLSAGGWAVVGVGIALAVISIFALYSSAQHVQLMSTAYGHQLSYMQQRVDAQEARIQMLEAWNQTRKETNK